MITESASCKLRVKFTNSSATSTDLNIIVSWPSRIVQTSVFTELLRVKEVGRNQLDLSAEPYTTEILPTTLFV